MEKTGLLSVVIPAYNEEPNIPLAVQAIGSALTQENIPYELLCAVSKRVPRHYFLHGKRVSADLAPL